MQSFMELNHPHSPVSTITTSSFEKLSDVDSLNKLVESCSIPSRQSSSSFDASSYRATRGKKAAKSKATSATPTSSKKAPTPRRRKRVSFETDTYGNVSTTVYLSETNTVAPHLIWWRREEIMAMHAEVFDVCDFFVRFRQDYVQSVVSLISDCTRSHSSRIRLRRRAQLVDVTNSSCRGLESTVVGIVQHRQERTVAKLLHHQQRLRGTTVEERAHLLAMQYKRSTQYASLWAQILADGDAMALDDDDDKCIR